MLSRIKQMKRVFLDRVIMLQEYLWDYSLYHKWNYNNPKVKSRASQEARILRQTHVIEKGMSLSSPRVGFGQPKIIQLFEMLDKYISSGFPTDSVPFVNAVSVVKKYLELQNTLGFNAEKIADGVSKYQKYMTGDFSSGILYTTYEQLKRNADGNFFEFFNSRHSIRQFSGKDVETEDIIKAVKLAMKAPTACNRQACKVYCYESRDINQLLGDVIAGNTGFENEVNKYLVVTADLSAFYDSFERNQIYIESGIFTLALVEALHYYGIASCILQNGERIKTNKKLKNICENIPENEKITVFVAIGHYKDEFSYAVSSRKNVEDVFIVKK